MLESHLISHLCLAVIKFLFGVLVNGIIVVVNDTHLIKQRKMIPLDLLVSCLAISRICLQLAIFYVNLAVLSLIEFPQLAEKFVILTFINESGLRFATWLSLFYCAKSATIAHPHFRLKMRISKWVPWLVLESPLYASSMDVFHSKHRWIFSKEHFLGLFSPNATTQSKKYLLYSLPFFLLSSHCHYLSSLFLLCSWYFLWGDTPDRWETQQQAPGTLAHTCTSALFSPSCPFWSSISATPWQLLCSFLKFSTLKASYFCSASCGLVHTTLDTLLP